MKIEGNVFAISGGSTGIGRALALTLVALGAKVSICGRNDVELNKTYSAMKGIVKDESLLHSYKCDVTNEQNCVDWINQVIVKFGKLDSLICSAGVNSHFIFEPEKSMEVYHKLMDVNYFGVIHCIRPAFGHLKSSKGRLIVISSVSGLMGAPYRSAYCASKAAITMFCESLRLEDLGVGVSIVCPGSIDSGMRERTYQSEHGITGGLPTTNSLVIDEKSNLNENEQTADNEFIPLDPMAPSKSADGRMSLHSAVDEILSVISKEDSLKVFPFKHSLAALLRRVLPDFMIDPLIKKGAKL